MKRNHVIFEFVCLKTINLIIVEHLVNQQLEQLDLA